jgi:hypothetical protein
MSRKDAYSWKAIVDKLLLPEGFGLISEKYDAELFGSFIAVYERRPTQIRYIWDGKDGWGYLEIRSDSHMAWVELGGTVPKDAPSNLMHEALDEWRSSLKAALS